MVSSAPLAWYAPRWKAALDHVSLALSTGRNIGFYRPLSRCQSVKLNDMRDLGSP
jgi:hypothetical protein